MREGGLGFPDRQYRPFKEPPRKQALCSGGVHAAIGHDGRSSAAFRGEKPGGAVKLMDAIDLEGSRRKQGDWLRGSDCLRSRIAVRFAFLNLRIM